MVVKAEEECRKMKDEFLSAEHILLAVSNYEKANSVFSSLGIKHNDLLKALQSVRGSPLFVMSGIWSGI